MAEIQQCSEDYGSGPPRKHHRLYLEDGTFVIQVCTTLVHVVLRSRIERLTENV
jgi:hypothetical protein